MDDDVPEVPPLRRANVFGALRPALVDLYYGSVRLVAANILWGLGLLVVGWLATTVGTWLAILAAPLLGLPLVGLYRIAALTTRSEEVVLSDIRTAIRERFLPSLIVAAGLIWAIVLLSTNIAIGLGTPSFLGWAFAILAGWALVAALSFAVAIWPLLGDPRFADRSLPALAKLAGFTILAAPVRLMVLALVVLFLAIASTIVFAAIITISLAYIALVSCRVVLPEADRLARHLTPEMDVDDPGKA